MINYKNILAFPLVLLTGIVSGAEQSIKSSQWMVIRTGIGQQQLTVPVVKGSFNGVFDRYRQPAQESGITLPTAVTEFLQPFTNAIRDAATRSADSTTRTTLFSELGRMSPVAATSARPVFVPTKTTVTLSNLVAPLVIPVPSKKKVQDQGTQTDISLVEEKIAAVQVAHAKKLATMKEAIVSLLDQGFDVADQRTKRAIAELTEKWEAAVESEDVFVQRGELYDLHTQLQSLEDKLCTLNKWMSSFADRLIDAEVRTTTLEVATDEKRLERAREIVRTQDSEDETQGNDPRVGGMALDTLVAVAGVAADDSGDKSQ